MFGFLFDLFGDFLRFSDVSKRLDRDTRKREKVFAETQIALAEEGHEPEWGTDRNPGALY